MYALYLDVKQRQVEELGNEITEDILSLVRLI